MRIIIFLFLLALALFCYFYLEVGFWFTKAMPITLTLDDRMAAKYSRMERIVLNPELKIKKDQNDDAAIAEFAKALANDPNDIDALEGMAEILTRKKDYDQAEILLQKIISLDPKQIVSLLNLSYTKYRLGKLNEAQALVGQVLNYSTDSQEQALAYMILGEVNGKQALKNRLLPKLKDLLQEKAFLLRAKELAPDIPETHVSLGIFYLFAPRFIGGSIYKAIQELEHAVKIAPNFATANARLAQAYKNKGDFEKYNFYLYRAKELDPTNDVLPELEDK